MRFIKRIFISFFLLVFVLQVFAQPSGEYTGKISILNQKIGIEVFLAEKEDVFRGHLSVPVQGAYNLELKKITLDHEKISFGVDTGMVKFRFEGDYFLDKDSMSGKFFQSGYEGTFWLTKPVKEKTGWVDKEVVFRNGDVQLAGTLSLPDTIRRHPAVILITGSGLQTRDENIFGFNIFKELAGYFVRSGFVVLRYDDRGAGDSDGGDVANCTTKDYAEDAKSAFLFLQQHPFVDGEKMGFLGHSEGAIIANMLANELPAAFVVMMSGPVIPGYTLLVLQNKAIQQAAGKDSASIEMNRILALQLFGEAKKKDADWNKVENWLEKALLNEVDSSHLEMVTSQQLAMLQKPWMQFFLNYDPGNDIIGVKCPVLAVFGGKDTQVPAKENMKRLQEIIKENDKLDIEILSFPEANHLFQEAKTGSPMEYGTLPKEFVKDFKEKITHWMQEKSSVKKNGR